uniref:SAP30-binding protein-like n=1 Tax=Geotrypetes seraphini TaxID=260995 RepID=A0A6P8QGG0_GEOSA|nr:SAP30-binding protein-like [Geotrypetes seraphini]
MVGSKNILSSLMVYWDDSEQQSEGEETAIEEKGGLVLTAYGDDEEDSETETGNLKQFSEMETRDSQELVASSKRVRDMSPDEIKIPPEPPGRCSSHLQSKIQKLHERKLKEGMNMNFIIQRKKEFQNPSIYKKLIQLCSIDELGTNYPKDIFDPHRWSEDSYYDALAKAQNVEMEKAKKEQTKKGPTTNTATATTNTSSTSVAYAQKRKSKWDAAIPVTTRAQPNILNTTATLPAVVTVTSKT